MWWWVGGGGSTHYRPYLRVYFSFRLVVLKGHLTFHYDPELDNYQLRPSWHGDKTKPDRRNRAIC